ncbi:hypothetical protein PVAND_007489 [Polypedilum vanderplanki]|uniref:Uncharacterized protein n=1 Tax=Polypedilum vanderplanki TaxID=319348 RepID=A0A9J6C7Y7_POLVA|nr:hypothetical protein PVAND_007489 [Polypedilum vanderplanki]
MSKIAVCRNCNYQNKIAQNAVAIRCERCRLIHCVMCKRNHDPACNLFEEGNTQLPQSQKPPANITTNAFYTSKSNTNISTEKYIVCESCHTKLNINYYIKHLNTKKHKSNVKSKQLGVCRSEPNFSH